LKDLQQQFEWNQAGQASGPTAEYAGMDISKNEDAAIKYGRDVQNRTEEAANATIVKLIETEEIATGTAGKLVEQTQQISQIDQSLGDIDAELERANRILKRMGRRIMTDKYIWCLIALIFIAICVIIGLSVAHGKVNTKDYQPNF